MGDCSETGGAISFLVQIFRSFFVDFEHPERKMGAKKVEKRQNRKIFLKITKNFSKGYGQKRFYVLNYGKTDKMENFGRGR